MPSFVFNKIVFDLSPEQYKLLMTKTTMTRRPLLYPLIKEIPNPINIDAMRKVTKEDGSSDKVYDKSPLVLKPGQVLFGIPSPKEATFMNMSRGSISVKLALPDGTIMTKEVEPKGVCFGDYDGTLDVCALPKEEGGPPSTADVVSNRQLHSNFVFRNGVSLPVEGAEHGITFGSLEEMFQFLKLSLTGDASVLEGAMKEPSLGSMKDYAGKVKGIPESWFKPAPGATAGLNFLLMHNAQAWALTCPDYHHLAMRLAQEIKEKTGVPPERQRYHEGDDRNYGLGLIPGNLRPVFERDAKFPGADIMGKSLTAAIHVAVELKTHAAYVEWFNANCPTMLRLVPDKEAPSSSSSLGARTASEADLPTPATGRTGSR